MPKTERTNIILVLTTFNEIVLSQALWEGGCAVTSDKLRLIGSQVGLF